MDDLGLPVPLARPPRRVVSLVPSLTEAVAVTAPELLCGATDYCTHPANLDVARVGGSKYPTLRSVVALHPDLVLANVEENRKQDVAALRDHGIPVWVTYPRTVAGAFESLRRLFEALALGTPAWLVAAETAWSAPALPIIRRRAVIPVWRRPWVVLGGDTFAGDVLRRLGIANVYDGDERYPRPSLEDVLGRRPELVVLPDEPYAFRADDGPEAFPGIPYALVSGRHLTWYGPSLGAARTLLAEQLSVLGAG